MTRASRTLLSVMLFLLFAGCGKDSDGYGSWGELDGPKVKILDRSSVDAGKIYIPYELRDMDLYRSSSRWFYGRSRQSEHFIVFWESGTYWDEYGETTTPSNASNSAYRVDIDDLLKKAESFYDRYVTEQKFCEPGRGKSCLDKYKIMIMLNHSSEWLATGAGYDDEIGALWVNPSSCQPAGSTIAHEIGHTFQYMVYCDQLLSGRENDWKSGWRYGFGGNEGNGFWEQTAQWQSFECYPEEIFDNWYYQGYLDDVHKHIFHEDPRYSNYFIHWYWTDRYGVEEISRLWKESRYPEDPAQTYMRLHGMDVGEFNDDIFEYARRMVTWDVDALRERGKDHIGAFGWASVADGDYRRVSVRKCPQSYGFNVITLKDFAEGRQVICDFEGITDDDRYNIISAQTAGWRYGFVAYKSSGERVYGDISREDKGQAVLTVPEGTVRLWLVVSATPDEYVRHAWDDDASNDEQWPYRVKFTGASVK